MSTLRKHSLNTDFEWIGAKGPFEVLTASQADQYNEIGGFVFENMFDAQELEALLADLDAFEHQANEFVRGIDKQQPSISRADEIVFSPHLVARSEVAQTFSKHPTLVQLCKDIIGESVRLYWDQLVYKRPGTPDEFPWHQDNGYTFVEPQHYLTCWVALTDATIENGCPWIAPTKHLSGTLHHKWTDIGFKCLDEVEDAIAMPLQAGSVAVFSSLTPHRTGPNLTDTVRKAYILQYAPDGAVIFPREGGEPIKANAPERQYLVT